MAQFASNLEKSLTGRKRPTMAIRLGFLIENLFVTYLLRSFTVVQILIFPHAELGASVTV